MIFYSHSSRSLFFQCLLLRKKKEKEKKKPGTVLGAENSLLLGTVYEASRMILNPFQKRESDNRDAKGRRVEGLVGVSPALS